MAAAPNSEPNMAHGLPHPTIEISLPGIPGFEKVARDAAAALADQMGFSQDRIEDLKTAVAEACMNAAEHGNDGDITAQVRVVLRAEESRLSVSVNDQGRGTLPDPLPEPGFPDRQRGWGLFFIDRLMDQVTIDRLPEGGNQVNMVIQLTRPSAASSNWSMPSSDASTEES